MSLTPLTALSPVDGRYAARCADLREIFSEQGLIRARVRVEIAWLHALAGERRITELRGVTAGRPRRRPADRRRLRRRRTPRR